MIQCEDLSKHFDTFKAVDGVTLDIQPGEVLALLGQNGAGKTTTVRMLTSILAPTRGWAKVAGYDTVKNAAEVRASVGVLTEMHGLYGRMTGYEYLDFFGQIYQLDKPRRERRSKELLEYFGLGQAGYRRSGEYSKGMRQKLALARALIHEPPVLLLDEPTSAMDPESAQLVRVEIARLRTSQRAIVICTHNLAEAEMLADKIAIIYRGHILMTGTLEEMRLKLLGPAEYIVRLAGSFQLGGLHMPEGVSMLDVWGDGFRFRVENPVLANPLILQQLFSSQIPVVAVQEVPRTLEMMYLKAMVQATEGAL
ncbi:MAG: ABC transporter ATP-binding protein [Chloroflexi bacterium]|nr:ABC transporter ATP-binding protein [Chloroflexota bacterium]